MKIIQILLAFKHSSSTEERNILSTKQATVALKKIPASIYKANLY